MRLKRFVQLYLGVIVTALTLINAYGISNLYHAGLDDSSQFYLWQDTQLAQDYYQQHHQLPASTSFRAFFLNIQAVPPHYAKPLTAMGWRFNQETWIQLTGESVYLMPFTLPQQAQPAFVLHRFSDADDEGYTESKLWTVAWQLWLFALPIIIIAIYILVYIIAEPIKKLSQWARHLSTENPPQRLANQSLHFVELQLLADQLYAAFQAISDSNEREKQFLRTLSHELRTPLAVTSATLELLAKKDQGQLQAFKPQLDRIFRANYTMRQLTEGLLWLWREPSQPLAIQTMPIKQVVEQTWQELQLYAIQPSTMSLEAAPDVTLDVPLALLQMVLANLFKNALSYGELNTLVVRADAKSIEVSNRIDSQKNEQGFGVGLYLIEHIMQRMGWQLTILTKDGVFVVNITF
jgi:signal transduction histidine kinase